LCKIDEITDLKNGEKIISMRKIIKKLKYITFLRRMWADSKTVRFLKVCPTVQKLFDVANFLF